VWKNIKNVSKKTKIFCFKLKKTQICVAPVEVKCLQIDHIYTLYNLSILLKFRLCRRKLNICQKVSSNHSHRILVWLKNLLLNVERIMLNFIILQNWKIIEAVASQQKESVKWLIILLLKQRLWLKIIIPTQRLYHKLIAFAKNLFFARTDYSLTMSNTIKKMQGNMQLIGRWSH
jgi:hypothetical protein